MLWRELSMRTPRDNEEMVCGLFYKYGAEGLEIDDPRDIMELHNDPEAWSFVGEEDFEDDGFITVKAYFPLSANTESLRLNLEGEIQSFPELKDNTVLREKSVDPADWAEEWKKYYKPVKIGENIWVRPTWEDLEVSEGAIVIDMDPGMAFGTGTHETTRLCVESIEKYMKPEMKLLDVGTGSGILSIAAALLGARHITAVDIDEVAVRSALDNVKRNHVDEFITVKEGNLLEGIDGKADLIVANIIAEIIAPMVPAVAKHLNVGGLFITSGIINEKADWIEETLLNNGFEMVERRKLNGWSVLVARI